MVASFASSSSLQGPLRQIQVIDVPVASACRIANRDAAETLLLLAQVACQSRPGEDRDHSAHNKENVGMSSTMLVSEPVHSADSSVNVSSPKDAMDEFRPSRSLFSPSDLSGQASKRSSAGSSSQEGPRRRKVRHADREAQARRNTMRAQLKLRALAITSRYGKPNPYQLFVMGWVFRDICPYPDQTWRAMVSIAVNWPLDKVTRWYENERRKNVRGKTDEWTARLQYLDYVEVEDRTMRLWRHAIMGPPQRLWTDARFQDALNSVVEARRRKFYAQLERSRSVSSAGRTQ